MTAIEKVFSESDLQAFHGFYDVFPKRIATADYAQFPKEVWHHIALFLPEKDIGSLRCVCRFTSHAVLSVFLNTHLCFSKTVNIPAFIEQLQSAIPQQVLNARTIKAQTSNRLSVKDISDLPSIAPYVRSFYGVEICNVKEIAQLLGPYDADIASYTKDLSQLKSLTIARDYQRISSATLMLLLSRATHLERLSLMGCNLAVGDCFDRYFDIEVDPENNGYYDYENAVIHRNFDHDCENERSANCEGRSLVFLKPFVMNAVIRRWKEFGILGDDQLPHLTFIDFTNTNLRFSIFEAFMRIAPHINRLNLTKCPSFVDAVPRLKENAYPRMRRLDLGGVSMNLDELKHLFKAMPNLAYLHLSNWLDLLQGIRKLPKDKAAELITFLAKLEAVHLSVEDHIALVGKSSAQCAKDFPGVRFLSVNFS